MELEPVQKVVQPLDFHNESNGLEFPILKEYVWVFNPHDKVYTQTTIGFLQ